MTPRIYKDDRGTFSETYRFATHGRGGTADGWVQDNFSTSRKNVLRGIHYQIEQPQGKHGAGTLTHGAVLDLAVDLRRRSASFGQHVSVELSGENGKMVWIPEGFLGTRFWF